MLSPPGSDALNTTRRLAAVSMPRALTDRVCVWEAPVCSFPPKVPPITSPAAFVVPPGHPRVDLPTHPCSELLLPGDVIVRIVLADPRPVPEKSSGATNISEAETVFRAPAMKITTKCNAAFAFFIRSPLGQNYKVPHGRCALFHKNCFDAFYHSSHLIVTSCRYGAALRLRGRRPSRAARWFRHRPWRPAPGRTGIPCLSGA